MVIDNYETQKLPSCSVWISIEINSLIFIVCDYKFNLSLAYSYHYADAYRHWLVIIIKLNIDLMMMN